MKTYIAKFWRGNPQLARGGYETTRTIRAKSMAGAQRQAREYEKSCVYGSMSLREITEAED